MIAHDVARKPLFCQTLLRSNVCRGRCLLRPTAERHIMLFACSVATANIRSTACAALPVRAYFVPGCTAAGTAGLQVTSSSRTQPAGKLRVGGQYHPRASQCITHHCGALQCKVPHVTCCQWRRQGPRLLAGVETGEDGAHARRALRPGDVQRAAVHQHQDLPPQPARRLSLTERPLPEPHREAFRPGSRPRLPGALALRR